MSKLEAEVSSEPKGNSQGNQRENQILELNSVQTEVASLQKKVDDKVYPRNCPLTNDAEANVVTRKDTMYRHTQKSLPQAVQSMYRKQSFGLFPLLQVWWTQSYGSLLSLGKQSTTTPAGQRVAHSGKNMSRYCNCCQKEEKDVNFKRSACKLVYYCSTGCHKRHWNEHQVLCKAIQNLPKPQGEHIKGLGDGYDSSVFISHITPKHHLAVARLVGRKCSVNCCLNDAKVTVLWYTGAQVFIITECFLKQQLPDLKVRDINELLGTDADLQLTAANRTAIPYKGSVEARFRLNSDEEKEVTVSFLVTKEHLDQPIIGYNIIELLVKDNENFSENSTLVQSVTSSFGNLEEKHVRQLVNLIKSNDSDVLCEVKSVKRDIVSQKHNQQSTLSGKHGKCHHNDASIV